MGFGEVLKNVLHWSPFLARGFLWNILISIVAMSGGTALGWGFALMRASSRASISRTGSTLTEFARNIPTFVFQFYLVFLLPIEISVPYFNLVVPIPAWLKVALALSMAVTGFVSDNLLVAIKAWRKGNHIDAMLFVPN